MHRTRLNPVISAMLRYIEAPEGTTDGAPPAPEGSTRPDTQNSSDEPLGEPGKKALDAERTARKDAEDRARTAADALTEAQQQHQTTAAELETATKRITELEAETTTLKEKAATAATQERDLWRYRALAEHSVPKDLHDLVQGETEEQMQAAAKKLAGLSVPDPTYEGLGGSRGLTPPTASSIEAGRDLFRSRRKTNT